MQKVDLPNQLPQDTGLKITALRQDVLDIFLVSKKPLSAYDVLAKLKKKRPKAQPPTVYRVIEYFMEKKVIHRIETGNKYVCCSQPNNSQSKYHGILFLCEKCQHSYEYMDEEFLVFIHNFTKRHRVIVNESVIEVNGVCESCST
jgi:Fur family zinc uptake transcriptional regulator